jgi:uncharacterized membrane protein
MSSLFSKIKNNEDGNSLVFFLVTFPLITVIFGLVVDSLLLSFARISVQSAADSAALVAANQIKNNVFASKVSGSYTQNLDHAKFVLACRNSVCGSNLRVVTDVANSRVCVSVSEKLNFLFLDTMPFGIFGEAGGDLKKQVEAFSDITIQIPRNGEANLSTSLDYACATIR